MSTASQKRFVSAEAAILGVLLGAVLIIWGIMAPPHFDAIAETLLTALYLTAAVAFVSASFKLPTFFTKSPFWSVVAMVVFCGVISLFFDSFAVVLLLGTVGVVGNKFNTFAFKAVAAVSALTVGGCFYLGELWGLPYYISSGLDNPTAGLPLLVVMLPFAFIIGAVVAKTAPVNLEPTEYTKEQLQGAGEITVLLLAIILTHQPLACLGGLLLYAAITGRIDHLIDAFLHELKEGAFSALGLIMVALALQALPGMVEWTADQLSEGWKVFVLAMASSPLAGAMLPPAETIHEFFVNLSYVMLGAPVLVSSSLVAIVVFRDTIDYEDLPGWMRPFASEEKGVMQEWVAYSCISLACIALLAPMLWAANASGILVYLYDLIH